MGNLPHQLSLKRSNFKKAAPSNPENTPSNKNQGSCVSRVKSKSGTTYHCSTPKKVRVKTAATTEEKTRGANRLMEKFPSTTCAAKTAPATGALQEAESPAAAAQ